MMMGLVPVRPTVQLSYETQRVSAGAARCVAESEGLQVGKTGGPAGCDRCQAVGCYFCDAILLYLRFGKSNLQTKETTNTRVAVH